MLGRWWRKRTAAGDPEGVARAQAELRHSQARYDETIREVTAPLAQMRARNNVTGLVDRLVHEAVRRRVAGNG